MPYNLGAVGFGHWFNRLYSGLKGSDEIRLSKIAGVSGVAGKLERMKEVGLSEKDYYMIENGSKISESFFNGLDIVHISDPNEYHAEQTIDSLRHGKVTVTEKTWGINRKEFEEVASFISRSRMESKAYLHLHYLQKQLTIATDQLLEKYTKEYGKVRRVSESFFEVESDEDMRRSKWLFSHKSGGLFMDWIHTFEVVVNGAKATKANIKDIELFAVNPKYAKEHPTGIEATVNLAGKHFEKGATATMRIAKGTKTGIKMARFYFDSGAYLDLEYLGSEAEFGSHKRGTWTVYNNGKAVASGCPKGPNTSEIFVEEILRMCKGGNAPLSVEQARMLFEPQWEYQEMSSSKRLNGSEVAIGSFIEKGLALG